MDDTQKSEAPKDNSWMEKMAWEREIADLKNKLALRQWANDEDRMLMSERIKVLEEKLALEK